MLLFVILMFLTSSTEPLSCSGTTDSCYFSLSTSVFSFMFICSSQGDVFTQDVKKASCGLKFMSSGFASDVTYDAISEKFSTSAVASVGFA